MDGFRAEVSHVVRTGTSWNSVLLCDWRWNFSFSPHSCILPTVTAMTPHAISPNQKFRNLNFSVKLMAYVFWDSKVIFLLDFMPPGSTIKTAVYCDTLTSVRRYIHNERREMLSRDVCPLRDNAAPFRWRHNCASGKIKVGWIGLSAVQSGPHAQCPAISTCFFT